MPNEAASDNEVLARRLYAALAEGDEGALREILHPEFAGLTTDGLPLGLGARTPARRR
jgi:2-(1,2-epoxy-1,2-dihydrophenyl)acetyl-CoA isomerase